MTEADSRPGATTPATPATAGAMLRAARESQGMHIALLAAAIKVSPRKLDALEHDRYQELTDATFVRALAQTVCRALKIDAAPVLALLPHSNVSPLGAANAGLNTPFRERPGRGEPSSALPQRPLIWAGLLLVLAAVLIAFAPASVWQWVAGEEPAAGFSATPPASTSAATAASAANAVAAAIAPDGAAASAGSPASVASDAASIAAPTVETVHAAPSDRAAADSAPNAATLSASEASWIEVVDASGATLLSRLLPPGETVTLQGPLPLKLKIGNARATQVVFRGQPVDLVSAARDNVARLELK
jgi:cytoskeleton protein RodZ